METLSILMLTSHPSNRTPSSGLFGSATAAMNSLRLVLWEPTAAPECQGDAEELSVKSPQKPSESS